MTEATPFKTENYNFVMSFDRAVSLLSINSYYLGGFLDDGEKPKQKYTIHRRGAGRDLKNPVGYISRGGLVRFVFQESSSYAQDRKLIKKVLGLKTMGHSSNNSKNKD